MRILLFGATGPTGIALARQILQTFDQCTLILFVRSPGKVPLDLKSSTSVTIIEGQLYDPERLAEAMNGVDVVLSTLGPSVTSGPFNPSDTPIAKGYVHIIDQMHQHNVKRLICLGTASITDPADTSNVTYSMLVKQFARNTYDHVNRLIWPGTASITDPADTSAVAYSMLVAGVKQFARNAYDDVVAIGRHVRTLGADLDWTIVRVPILTDCDTKEVVAGYIGDPRVKIFLSRAGFAAFVINEIEKREWVQKAPMISS